MSDVTSRGIAATAFTDVFGDGQKLIAVVLRYPHDLQQSSVKPSTFSANSGWTVSNAYVSNAAEPTSPASDGRYVIVQLSTDAPMTHATEPSFINDAALTQVQPIMYVDGAMCPARERPIVPTSVVNLVVDEFDQATFISPRSGETIHYNLFVPRGYDPTRTYPLVLFMHDLGACSEVTTTTLTQGNGAICWARPEEQQKRPAFVVAPQYTQRVVNDRSEASTDLDLTVELVSWLMTQHNIDRNRLYTTGQSMGGMMSIALNIAHPDLFAASYVVAAQWDATKVAPMATDHLWIMVSEGDEKAYPGQNAITAALEAAGARVSRARWNATSTQRQFATAVVQQLAAAAPINYTILDRDTVVPTDQEDTPLAQHLNTWRYAYNIEGIREWLFRQGGDDPQ